MITKNHSNYLKFLAKGHSTLLLSSSHYDQYDAISEYFNASIQRKLSEEELENAGYTVVENNIDIVILDFINDYDFALKFYEIMINHEPRITIIGLFANKCTNDKLALIKEIDSLLFEDFNVYQLKDKLFTQLSIFYTIKSIGRRDTKIDAGSLEMGIDLDEFFDTYEGSSLFIVDELVPLSKSLRSGDLNPQLLENISEKLMEISDIFRKNKDVADISPIFKDLSKYLEELDFSTIKPESLYAFDYICEILDDTSTCIMDMFVDRVFKDTYIVKHSLKNNIEFMKNILESHEDDANSELEFF